MTAIAGFLARFLARIVGPRVFAAVPWRAVAWLALIAGLAAFLWGVERHGKAVQRVVDAKIITALRTDLATSQGNVVSMRSAIAQQNAAVTALQVAADARVADAHRTATLAQERAKAHSGMIATLDKAGRSPGIVTCPVSTLNRAASDAL